MDQTHLMKTNNWRVRCVGFHLFPIQLGIFDFGRNWSFTPQISARLVGFSGLPAGEDEEVVRDSSILEYFLNLAFNLGPKWLHLQSLADLFSQRRAKFWGCQGSCSSRTWWLVLWRHRLGPNVVEESGFWIKLVHQIWTQAGDVPLESLLVRSPKWKRVTEGSHSAIVLDVYWWGWWEWIRSPGQEGIIDYHKLGLGTARCGRDCAGLHQLFEVANLTKMSMMQMIHNWMETTSMIAMCCF